MSSERTCLLKRFFSHVIPLKITATSLGTGVHYILRLYIIRKWTKSCELCVESRHLRLTISFTRMSSHVYMQIHQCYDWKCINICDLHANISNCIRVIVDIIPLWIRIPLPECNGKLLPRKIKVISQKRILHCLKMHAIYCKVSKIYSEIGKNWWQLTISFIIARWYRFLKTDKSAHIRKTDG